MMKFRMKPVVVEAWKASDLLKRAKDDWEALPTRVVAGYDKGDLVFASSGIRIVTPEGTMSAEYDDWVICGGKGEFYPCTPDIFAATYEAVDEDTQTEPPADKPVYVRDGAVAGGNAAAETEFTKTATIGTPPGAFHAAVRGVSAPVTAEVASVKRLRKGIDTLTQEVKSFPPTRERSLAITKLQEAIMWLGMDLKRIGEANPGLLDNPYPNSKNVNNADGLRM